GVIPCERRWLERAEAYQQTLTMPPGSLGRLTDLARRLCAVQETLRPVGDPAAVVVCAADHGVARAGVSAYPQDVTRQMVANFLAGGAAISVMARHLGVRVVVADLGVIGADPPSDSRAEFIRCPVAEGTRNLCEEAAMSL